MDRDVAGAVRELGRRPRRFPPWAGRCRGCRRCREPPDRPCDARRPSGLMRTHHCGPPERLPRSLRISRAAAFWPKANAVLEIEDDRVGLAFDRLGDLLLAVRRHEQPAARLAHAGFFSSSAERVHSQTSSPRWLKLRCAQVTMPAFGRDLLSRRSMHSLSLRKRVADEDRLRERRACRSRGWRRACRASCR